MWTFGNCGTKVIGCTNTCAIHAHTSFISTLICRRFLVSGSPGIFILSERSLRGRHSPVFSVLVTSLLSSSGLPDVALASLLHSSSIFAGMSKKLELSVRTIFQCNSVWGLQHYYPNKAILFYSTVMVPLHLGQT